MALKRLNKIAETAPKTGKAEKPVFVIDGDDVTKFNKATAALKEAEADQKLARTELLEVGMGLFFQHNHANSASPATSIELVDDNGNKCRVSFQEKYSAADPAAAEALFDNLGADINDYMQETVSAGFDCSVFNAGAEGRFSQDVFNVYDEAIKAATTKLIGKGMLPVGTASPLSTTKKVLPLKTFHAKRFERFNDTENKEISLVVKNTVTVTPIVAA